MKKTLALASVLCSPIALAGVAVPKVLGILLALLQLGSNIGFGTLIALYMDINLISGVGLFGPTDFLFLL